MSRWSQVASSCRVLSVREGGARAVRLCPRVRVGGAAHGRGAAPPSRPRIVSTAWLKWNDGKPAQKRRDNGTSRRYRRDRRSGFARSAGVRIELGSAQENDARDERQQRND